MTWKSITFDETLWRGRFTVGKLKRSDYQEEGPLPIIDQGQEPIAGYTSRTDLSYDGPLPVVVFGDHTRAMKYVDCPFVAGADGTKVLVPDTECFDPRFYYYALRALEIPSRGYNRHYSLLREQRVVAPPLDEQRRIARILSTIHVASDVVEHEGKAAGALFDSLTAALLEPYTDITVPLDSRARDTERVTLGQVAEFVRGVSYKPADLRQDANAGGIPLLRATNIIDNRIVTTDVVYVDQARVAAAQYLRPWDVVVAMSSGSRKAVGKLGQLGDHWTGTFGAFCGVIRPREDAVNPRFLGYLVRSRPFRDRIELLAQGTNIRNLSKGHLLGFEFVMPSVDEQERVARILSTTQHASEAIAAERMALDAVFDSSLTALMARQ